MTTESIRIPFPANIQHQILVELVKKQEKKKKKGKEIREEERKRKGKEKEGEWKESEDTCRDAYNQRNKMNKFKKAQSGRREK